MTNNLTDFRKADIRPLGPSGAKGYIFSRNEDDTRYLMRPDAEFYRPWLATPGGTAFIWPGGIEGFSLTGNATTGIHHSIGSVHTDVQVVYPDEQHIILNGNFMGKTSVENVRAIRSVILQDSTEDGKILALPGVESQLLFVQVINNSFTHDQGDRTRGIAYSIEFIKVRTGRTLKTTPLLIHKSAPALAITPRGKSNTRTTVKQGKQTLRGISAGVHGTFGASSFLDLMSKNTKEIEKTGIPRHKITQVKLPLGTKLNI